MKPTDERTGTRAFLKGGSGRWRLAGVCAGVLASAAAAQEPVTLSAVLSEGQVLRYDVDATLEVQASKEPERVEQGLRLRFTVAHADKEGALVRCRVESAKVRAKPPGKDASEFGWKEGDAAGPEDEPAVARLYRRLGAAMIEVTLDAHGAVKSVSGLDDVAEDGSQSRALGVLAPESAARMLQGVFTLDPDGRPRRTGERWTWAQPFPAGVWMASMSTEYNLVSFAGSVAKVRAETTVTPRQPRAVDAGVSPRLEVTSQSIKTDAEWDTAHGQLIRRNTVSEVELTSTLELKEPIVAKTTSRSRVVFTRADPPK